MYCKEECNVSTEVTTINLKGLEVKCKGKYKDYGLLAMLNKA